jgi:hypothetical protein
MKKYLAILLFFLALAAEAQTMAKAEIIGKWKTVKVEAVSKMPVNELKEMQQMFSNSTFDFQVNGVSKISLPGGD